MSDSSRDAARVHHGRHLRSPDDKRLTYKGRDYVIVRDGPGRVHLEPAGERESLTARRYTGEIAPGMVFSARDNGGRLGWRRVRVIGPHPFAGEPTLILEELPSRMLRGRLPGEVFRCPELNLRIVLNHLEVAYDPRPAKDCRPT